jgi:hypothetical protein
MEIIIICLIIATATLICQCNKIDDSNYSGW